MYTLYDSKGWIKKGKMTFVEPELRRKRASTVRFAVNTVPKRVEKSEKTLKIHQLVSKNIHFFCSKSAKKFLFSAVNQQKI